MAAPQTCTREIVVGSRGGRWKGGRTTWRISAKCHCVGAAVRHGQHAGGQISVSYTHLTLPTSVDLGGR
eukprot:9994272-Prorocentrum_lima.AAC.1